MIVLDSFAGSRAGVLGLGRTGLAAARALRAGGADVRVWDDSESARAVAREAGFAPQELTREGACAGLALLAVSPGVPHLYPRPHPAVQAALAAGVPLDNDIGLLFGWLKGRGVRVVAVTGSNGKSTTAALIGHLLEKNGRPARVAGNIGFPVLALEPPGRGDILVLEISSYQAELARRLAPDVAVFLNFADDHLARHGGGGGYLAAKARLFREGAPAHAVVGVQEEEGRWLASVVPPRKLVAIGLPEQVAGYPRAVAHGPGGLQELRAGVAQHAALPHAAVEPQNAAAALAVSRIFRAGHRTFGAALCSFPGLPHRRELIGEAAGVRFVNDSKATNAAAAAQALSAAARVRWIAGGRAKEGGIGAISPLFPRVAKAYLIGEAAPAFARALGTTPHEIAGTLEAAAAKAFAEARDGETVLLSPACASFDQFSDFEARGDAFRGLVAAHLASMDGGARGSSAND